MASRDSPRLRPVRPMLATAGEVPGGSGWAFEWKFDGIRAVVSADAGEVAVFSRSLRPITGSVPG